MDSLVQKVPEDGDSQGTILVVDDDDFVRLVITNSLREEGFIVEQAETGEIAMQALSSGSADAVVSDILMPGLSGVEMLRLIRSRGLDIPVVLLTGSPSFATAVQAVEGGAFRYLTKSADMAGLVEVMRQAVRLSRLMRWRRDSLVITRPRSEFVGERAGMNLAFDKALEGLWLAAQPIVGARDGAIFGVELLARTVSVAFTSVSKLLDVAEELGRIRSFGRTVRRIASNVDVPSEQALFVNVHSVELDDEDLYSEKNPLCHLGSRVVLEVTERQSLEHVKNLKEKIAALRDLGFWIAVDDLGAGYASLNTFVDLRPNLVKLDMAIVRGIDSDPYRRTLVQSMLAMCRDFSVPLVAEGVETEAEKAVLIDLGCDLLQGFLCGAPQAPRQRNPPPLPPPSGSPRDER